MCMYCDFLASCLTHQSVSQYHLSVYQSVNRYYLSVRHSVSIIDLCIWLLLILFGIMYFWLLMITPKEDGRLSTAVYRKPTHTDLYLQWHSHHTILSKYSVVGTLHHRAKTICSSPQLLQQEEDHLYGVLTRCKYPVWAVNRVKIKMKTPAQQKNTKNNAKN